MSTDGAATTGRTIAGPAFPGDDGSADPALSAALERWRGRGEGDQGAERAVYEALLGARLLVPIVAVEADESDAPLASRASPVSPASEAAEAEAHGAEMRLLAVVGPGGARGLPAFTGIAGLTGWNAAARPVAVPAVRAAQAALSEGASALIVDPGPDAAPFVVQGPALRALAAGRLPLSPAEDPDVVAVVRGAVDEYPAVQVVRFGADVGGALVLVLEPSGALDAAAEAARAIGRRLAGSELLRERLSRPMELALVPRGAAHGR